MATTALQSIAAEDTDDSLRQKALLHLLNEHIDDQDTQAFLTDRLCQDPSPTVRHALLDAWLTGASLPPVATTALQSIAAKDTHRTLRHKALTHLMAEGIDDPGIQAFLVAQMQATDPVNVTRGIADAQSSCGGVESVLTRVARSWPVSATRWAATLALTPRLSAEQAACVLAERALEDPDRFVRKAALKKFTQEVTTGGDRRELLHRVACEDPHPTMRGAALALLTTGSPQDRDLRATLTQRAEQDHDRDIRWVALKSLAVLFGDEEACTLFATCAAEDPDVDLRWAAAVVMANRWPDRRAAAVDQLRAQACAAPDSEGRWLALAALAELPGATEEMSLLAVRADSDPDPSVCRAAFDVCIGATAPDGPLSVFGRSRDERLFALQSRLLTATDDDGRLVAERSATHDPDPKMRERVLIMVALHWPDRRTTALLADRASSDSDPAVRALATRLLSTFRQH
ncbi:HEAT repeat domain-containing protein [Streptomyces massasporeus]|uniref:HEAT repeat domain-containing protein n=1 Tax=Streptomyces massasporeus TaxID=67324 RepID=UPI0036F620FB